MTNDQSTRGQAITVFPHPRPEWNDTQRSYPAATCLHHLVEGQARRVPNQVALFYEGETLTYGDLSLRANQVARRLADQGVGPESLVGVWMERSLELPIALLGVLKAGAAYVPLDPNYPTERLRQMIDDADPLVVLTQQHLLNSVRAVLEGRAERAGAAVAVVLDDEHGEVASQSTEHFEASVQPDNLAYVIYTSGSTGLPKGAMNTHRGICNRLLWMQDEYKLSSKDTILQKTPASFDVSVWEFFWPLIVGAKMVLAKPQGHLDSNYLCDLIQAQQVTVIHFVPSMLRVFLEEPELERCRSLRDVICSGEAMTFDLQQRFFERLDARLHNLYGPTEAAIDVTYWECQSSATDPVVPIGHPVANTQIHLLDEAMQPVPVGASGELHIGGVQVARGYLNRPELTSEQFVADPFASDPGARLYKTGDLARYRSDGSIEYLGRIDQQVKIRGFRIELTEIEAVLMDHPRVYMAAVSVKEYGSGDRRLVAYLVPSGQMPSAGKERGELIQQARGLVQQKLPEYMTPSLFVLLPELPMTASGKLDRNGLPEPSSSRPDLDQPLVLPRTELEKRLTEKWQDVLRLQQIGIHDRFFELGGDSLRAAAFVNWLQEELGEFIYVVTIFQSPTVAEYAKLLQRDYAPALSAWLGVDDAADDVKSNEPADRRVDQQMLQRMRDAIPRMNSVGRSTEKKNPRAVFILAPPRSGTTLLRVMLAGHPQLFAATELQLLCFETLAERTAAFTGKYSVWLEGTIRAIMELRRCDVDQAKAIMQKYEDDQFSTKDFYRQLQQWSSERLLVDKSPHYALDDATLRKAEVDFEDPFYIHLVRHPYAMVQSFENQHMDQVLYLNEHDFSVRQLGELVWTLSHQTVINFLAEIPSNRQHRILFEQLAQQPNDIMRDLCAALGVEFHPDVLNPYQDQDKKMVDGIYESSTPMGDVNFLRHQTIDPRVAVRWKEAEQDNFLGEVTWDVAEQLGYPKVDADSSKSLHWAQQKTAAKSRRQQQRLRRTKRTGSRTDNLE